MTVPPQDGLRHWTVRLENGNLWTVAYRGDVFLELISENPSENAAAHYTAWARLIHAQMDKMVDEARCKETGGHEWLDDRCTKCFAWDLDALGAPG